jgi:hypothetical protein
MLRSRYRLLGRQTWVAKKSLSNEGLRLPKSNKNQKKKSLLHLQKNISAPSELIQHEYLARIESLLVAVGTTVDRIERLASRIDVQTRKQDGKRRSEL